MQYVVCAYDVSDDTRRTRVFKALEGFGRHMQFSLFECCLPETDILKMKAKIEGLIDPKEDSVVYFDLCGTCQGKIQRMGVEKDLPPGQQTIII